VNSKNRFGLRESSNSKDKCGGSEQWQQNERMKGRKGWIDFCWVFALVPESTGISRWPSIDPIVWYEVDR
jgi:hypothetical protein